MIDKFTFTYKTKNKHKNRFVRLTAAALTLLMLFSALSFVGCSSSGEESSSFAKIKKNGEKITVTATVSNDDEDVFLFAIDIWDSPSVINELEPIVKAKVKHREAKATFKVEGNIHEMLCKGYVFGMISADGEGYEQVSDVYYITNPKDLHKDSDKIDESETKGDLKGLIGTPSQLMELGATSTLVTVDIGTLLAGEGGRGVHSFIWNGVTCHVYQDKLDALDREIRGYTEAGISVYLEIIQSTPYGKLEDGIKDIAFEGSVAASAYALNMQSRNGANKICGVLDLLASRYSGGEYGRADGFIIGRAVNKFGTYYSDTLSTESSIKNYVNAVRMAYNILLSHNPHGRVYISLGNNWTVAESRGLSAKDMLTTFVNIAEEGGDFFWQLCIEANASDASNSAIWEDSLAIENGQFISPANIETVTKLFNSSAYACNGQKRNLLLNRFAIGGADTDKQATSYAYAYYKALNTGKIDALIYAQAIDSAEDTVNAGLYFAEGAVLPQAKKLATIFEAVDNEKIGDVAYISGFLGDKWNKLYSSLSKDAVNREVTAASPSAEHSREELTVIADFKNGNMHGFTPISAQYAELRYSESWSRPVLYAKLAPSFRADKGGVVTSTITLEQLKKAGYLSLTARLDTSSEAGELSIRLSGFDKNGKELVYSSTSLVKSGEWAEMYYDIQDFIKKIDSETLTLAITGSVADANSDAEGLWIYKVSAEEPSTPSFPFWIIWVLVGIVAVGGITAFVIWFRKNYTFVRE